MSMTQISLPAPFKQCPQLTFCGDVSLSEYAELVLKAPAEFVSLKDANSETPCF